MKENLTKKIIRIAVVAALYAVLTLALSWISFNSIQFRVAEIFEPTQKYWTHFYRIL